VIEERRRSFFFPFPQKKNLKKNFLSLQQQLRRRRRRRGRWFWALQKGFGFWEAFLFFQKFKDPTITLGGLPALGFE